MDSPRCPISGSSRLELLEKIGVEKLTGLYRDLCAPGSLPFKNLEYIFKYKSVDNGYVFFYPFWIAGGSLLYQDLGKFDWYYLKDKWEYDATIQFIKSNDKVLEIGCGEGAFLHMAKRNGPKVVGLELNERACEVAKKNGLQVYGDDIYVFSKQNKGRFDVACMFQVLEHVPHVREFLSSVLAVLRPGGKLIVCVPNNDSFIKFDLLDPLNLPPHHMGHWSTQSLQSLPGHLDVELERTINGPLESYHVDWYIRIQLRRFLGERVSSWALQVKGFTGLLRKFVHAQRNRILGHSILAIYQKK